MPHAESLREGAAERYVLGELTEQQALEYEAHFFECAECAEEVKAAAGLADAARDAFQAQAARKAARDVSPVVDRTRRAWLMPSGLAAAAVLALGAAAYQAVLVVPPLKREVAQLDALQPAHWFFLSVSRAQPPVVELAPGERRMGVTLSRSSERTHPYYRCRLVDGHGQVVETMTVSGPLRDGELQILLPAARLSPGSYAIEVAGLDAPGAAAEGDVVRYLFELRRREGNGSTPP